MVQIQNLYLKKIHNDPSETKLLNKDKNVGFDL